MIKCNYSDGKREGVYSEWYENGQIEEECNYFDGEKKECIENGITMVK